MPFLFSGSIDSNSTLAGVTSAPKTEVVGLGTWTVLMDAMVVNGKNVTGHSNLYA